MIMPRFFFPWWQAGLLRCRCVEIEVFRIFQLLREFFVSGEAGVSMNRSSRISGLCLFRNRTRANLPIYLTFRWDFWVFKPMPILAMCENLLPAFDDIGHCVAAAVLLGYAGSGNDSIHYRLFKVSSSHYDRGFLNSIVFLMDTLRGHLNLSL